MLQIKDIRESKVFQEALEEGREEGREEIAIRLLAKRFSVADVAELTGLPMQRIKKLKRKASNGS